MTKLRPFWSYFGSAWLKTRRGMYPPPKHGTIIEPFAGSVGYSLHYSNLNIVLADADPAVLELWRYLIGASESEILALPDIHADEPVSNIQCSEGGRLLISWWLGRARSRPSLTVGRWAREHDDGRFWGAQARARIAGQISSIRHWTVIDGGYEAVQNQRATWFIDPPYSGTPGRRYAHGSYGFDYQLLRQWALARSGFSIVCEAHGADWLPFLPVGIARSASGLCAESVCLIQDGWIVGGGTAEMIY